LRDALDLLTAVRQELVLQQLADVLLLDEVALCFGGYNKRDSRTLELLRIEFRSRVNLRNGVCRKEL